MSESASGTTRWESLEQWSPILFFVGGVLFVVSAALVVVEIVAGAERLGTFLGEAFTATGWTAGFIGLLGLYPELAGRSRRLARAGAVFAAIGAVGLSVLAVVSLVAFVTGTAQEDLPIVFIFPAVLIGSLLAFSTFGVASLRTDIRSRTVGILLLVPSILFVVNVLFPSSTMVILVVVSGLAVVHLTIGYVLRSESVPTDHVEPSPDSTVR